MERRDSTSFLRPRDGFLSFCFCFVFLHPQIDLAYNVTFEDDKVILLKADFTKVLVNYKLTWTGSFEGVLLILLMSYGIYLRYQD